MERHVGVRGGTGSQGWCFLGAVVGFFGVGRGGFCLGEVNVYARYVTPRMSLRRIVCTPTLNRDHDM